MSIGDQVFVQFQAICPICFWIWWSLAYRCLIKPVGRRCCRSFVDLGQMFVKLWDLIFGLLNIFVMLGFFGIADLQEVSPVSLIYTTTL